MPDKHEDLQAVGTLLIAWGTIIALARLDKTDIPDPTNLYLSITWTAAITIFSPVYFYWKRGHPLVPVARTLVEILKGIGELFLGGFFAILGLAALVAIVEIAPKSPLSAQIVPYSIALAVVALIGIFSLLGSLALGLDAVGRLRGRRRRVIPFDRISLKRGTPAQVVRCSNPKCDSRYLADPETVALAQTTPHHFVPCKVCGEHASIVQEYL